MRRRDAPPTIRTTGLGRDDDGAVETEGLPPSHPSQPSGASPTAGDASTLRRQRSSSVKMLLQMNNHGSQPSPPLSLASRPQTEEPMSLHDTLSDNGSDIPAKPEPRFCYNSSTVLVAVYLGVAVVLLALCMGIGVGDTRGLRVDGRSVVQDDEEAVLLLTRLADAVTSEVRVRMDGGLGRSGGAANTSAHADDELAEAVLLTDRMVRMNGRLHVVPPRFINEVLRNPAVAMENVDAKRAMVLESEAVITQITHKVMRRVANALEEDVGHYQTVFYVLQVLQAEHRVELFHRRRVDALVSRDTARRMLNLTLLIFGDNPADADALVEARRVLEDRAARVPAPEFVVGADAPRTQQDLPDSVPHRFTDLAREERVHALSSLHMHSRALQERVAVWIALSVVVIAWALLAARELWCHHEGVLYDAMLRDRFNNADEAAERTGHHCGIIQTCGQWETQDTSKMSRRSSEMLSGGGLSRGVDEDVLDQFFRECTEALNRLQPFIPAWVFRRRVPRSGDSMKMPPIPPSTTPKVAGAADPAGKDANGNPLGTSVSSRDSNMSSSSVPVPPPAPDRTGGHMSPRGSEMSHGGGVSPAGAKTGAAALLRAAGGDSGQHLTVEPHAPKRKRSSLQSICSFDPQILNSSDVFTHPADDPEFGQLNLTQSLRHYRSMAVASFSLRDFAAHIEDTHQALGDVSAIVEVAVCLGRGHGGTLVDVTPLNILVAFGNAKPAILASLDVTDTINGDESGTRVAASVVASTFECGVISTGIHKTFMMAGRGALTLHGLDRLHSVLGTTMLCNQACARIKSPSEYRVGAVGLYEMPLLKRVKDQSKLTLVAFEVRPAREAGQTVSPDAERRRRGELERLICKFSTVGPERSFECLKTYVQKHEITEENVPLAPQTPVTRYLWDFLSTKVQHSLSRGHML